MVQAFDPRFESFSSLVAGNRSHPHQFRSAHGMAEQGGQDQVSETVKFYETWIYDRRGVRKCFESVATLVL